MPLILPGNVASATASTTYDVDNSCMFNGVDTYLSRTTSATAPTLSTKATLSFWIKMCEIAASSQDYVTYTNGAVVPYFNMQLPNGSSQQLALYEDGSSQDTTLVTTKVFRDPAAWYHVCYSYDSTPSTPSSSSIKLFINGVQQTAFSSETYPAQNSPTNLTTASVTHPIGVHANTSSQFLNAYLAEYMLVDGQALDADSFGEFDSDSPTIWKPIDISGITVGNQGYYLDFKDSSNLGNDVGGNDFDFTSNNIDATNQATDTPTNNFCVINPLDNYFASAAFKQGNLDVTSSSSTDYSPHTSTFWLGAGKWYCECKETTGVGGGTGQALIGITDRVSPAAAEELGNVANEYGYYQADGNVRNSNSGSSFGDNYTANDIIGIALDLTNSKLYFSKNGVWQDSGDPTSGATGTGAVSITAVGSTTNGLYTIAATAWSTASQNFQWNFGGCPAFAISSGNADANGYGAFEYAPPTGFLSICSKNLGSDGG